MAYENEAADLNILNAKRISAADNSKTKDKSVTLTWARTGDERRQTCLDYLNTIVTVTNQKYDRGKATLSGLWRNAGTGYNAQGEFYFLNLREGWATTVLDGALPNSECMIQTGSDSRSDARSYAFYWKNIASGSVNACVASLRAAATFTDPTIQGEVKTGSYAISDITPTQQSDGSYWITVNCLKVAVITAIGDLSALSPIRKDIHDIENPFGLEGGYTTHVGRKPTDGIVLTYRALASASRAVIMALTDAQLQTLVGVADATKYEFVKRELGEDAGNTLTLTLVYQYIPLALTTPESAARKVSFGLSNQSGKLTMKRSWPRIDPTQSKDLLTANANQKVTDGEVTDPMMDGVLYTGTWLARTTISEMTGNDGDRIEQELIKEGDQALNLKYGNDPLHVTYELWRVDASVTKIDDFMAQTGSEAVGVGTPIDFKWDEPELGITKIVKVDWNADRSANLHAIYSTANDLERIELFTIGVGAPGKLTIQDNQVSTSERSWGWNIPVSALKTYSDYYNPTTQVVNTKNEFKISRRDEHTFDFEGVLTTFVTVDSGDVVIEDNDEKTVTRRTGEYVLVARIALNQDFGPITQLDGTVVVVDPKPNDVGSYSVVRTKTVYHEQSGSSSSNKGLVESVSTATLKATATTPTLTADAVNAISAIEIVPRPDGLKDTEKKDTTLSFKTIVNSVISERDAFHTKTLTKVVNGTSMAGPAAYGKATAEHNGAGGVHTVLEEIAEVNTTSQDVISTPLQTITIDKNSASTAATLGTVSQNNGSKVVNKPTPGGNVESEKTGTVKTSWDSGAFVVTKNIGGVFTEKTQRFRNKVAIPAATAGQLVKALENELASFDGEIMERLAETGAASGIVSVRSAIYEWKSSVGTARFPIWNTSTNPDLDPKIVGYNFFQHELPYRRSVVVTITRKYSITHPAATAIDAGAWATANASFANGGGINYINQVVELGEGLFAVDEKVLTTSDWVAKALLWTALYSTTA